MPPLVLLPVGEGVGSDLGSEDRGASSRRSISTHTQGCTVSTHRGLGGLYSSRLSIAMDFWAKWGSLIWLQQTTRGVVDVASTASLPHRIDRAPEQRPPRHWTYRGPRRDSAIWADLLTDDPGSHAPPGSRTYFGNRAATLIKGGSRLAVWPDPRRPGSNVAPPFPLLPLPQANRRWEIRYL